MLSLAPGFARRLQLGLRDLRAVLPPTAVADLDRLDGQLDEARCEESLLIKIGEWLRAYRSDTRHSQTRHCFFEGNPSDLATEEEERAVSRLIALIRELLLIAQIPNQNSQGIRR